MKNSAIRLSSLRIHRVQVYRQDSRTVRKVDFERFRRENECSVRSRVHDTSITYPGERSDTRLHPDSFRIYLQFTVRPLHSLAMKLNLRKKNRGKKIYKKKNSSHKSARAACAPIPAKLRNILDFAVPKGL